MSNDYGATQPVFQKLRNSNIFATEISNGLRYSASRLVANTMWIVMT